MHIFDSAVFYVKYNPRGGFLLFIKKIGSSRRNQINTFFSK